MREEWVVINPGDKFGFLTVQHKVLSEIGRSRYLCKCVCGNEKIVLQRNLLRGYTKSCGCLRGRALTAFVKAKAAMDDPPPPERKMPQRFYSPKDKRAGR